MKKAALVVWLYALIFWITPWAVEATGIVKDDWLEGVRVFHWTLAFAVIAGVSIFALMKEIDSRRRSGTPTPVINDKPVYWNKTEGEETIKEINKLLANRKDQEKLVVFTMDLDNQINVLHVGLPPEGIPGLLITVADAYYKAITTQTAEA